MTTQGFFIVLFSNLALPAYPYPGDTIPDNEASLPPAITDVSELLGRDPKKTDYIVETECIPVRRIESMEVIDKKHIIVEMKANNYFLILSLIHI